jgi:hypothetical protein
MANLHVSEYITNQLRLGKTVEQIRQELLRAGWDEETIRASLEGGHQNTMTSKNTSSLPGPIELFSEAWRVFKKRWKPLVGLSFIPGLVALGVVFILLLVMIFVGIVGQFNVSTISSNTPLLILLAVIGVIFYIVLLALLFWVQLTLLLVIVQHDEETTANAAFHLARSKLWPYFVTVIIMGILTFSGYLLFIIPGIVLSIWFSFAGFIVLKENRRGVDALIMSRGYVRGYGWEVAWRFIAFWLIYLGMFIVTGAISSIVESTRDAATTRTFQASMQFIVSIAQIILNIMAIIYAYLIYEHLRKIKGPLGEVAASSRRKYKTFMWLGLVLSIVSMVALVYGGYAVSRYVYEAAKNTNVFQNLTSGSPRVFVVRAVLTQYQKEHGVYPSTLEEAFSEERRSSNGVFTDFKYSATNEGRDFVLCDLEKKEAKVCYDSHGKIDSLQESAEPDQYEPEESSESSTPGKLVPRFMTPLPYGENKVAPDVTPNTY